MDSICRETPKGVRSEQRWSPQMLSWICWAALILHGAMMQCGALKLCLSDSWLCSHLNASTPPSFTTTSLHFVLLIETWVGLALGVHLCSLIAFGNSHWSVYDPQSFRIKHFVAQIEKEPYEVSSLTVMCNIKSNNFNKTQKTTVEKEKEFCNMKGYWGWILYLSQC